MALRGSFRLDDAKRPLAQLSAPIDLFVFSGVAWAVMSAFVRL